MYLSYIDKIASERHWRLKIGPESGAQPRSMLYERTVRKASVLPEDYRRFSI
jgi:hypothetical protein